MSVLNINTKKSLNLYIQNIDNSYYNNLLTTSSATLTYVDSTNKIKSSVYDNNAIYFINQQNNLSVNTIINYQKKQKKCDCRFFQIGHDVRKYFHSMSLSSFASLSSFFFIMS